VELLKLHLFADCEDHKWAMEVSADDKAYVRPETSGYNWILFFSL
jgi:hypothetical protein